jgi:transposase
MNLAVSLSFKTTPGLFMSSAEVRILLDLILEELERRHSAGRHESSWIDSAAPFQEPTFREILRAVRATYSPQTQPPQFLITLGPPLQVEFEKQLLADLIARIERLKECRANPNLLAQIARHVGWVVDVQLRMAKWLIEQQSSYLRSRRLSDLKAVGIAHVANEIGYHATTVYRLIRNVTVRMENGDGLSLRELMPGEHGLRRQIIKEALTALARNSEHYSSGRWKINRDQLAELLAQKTEIRLDPRTVGSYLQRLGLCSEKRHRCILCNRYVYPLGNEYIPSDDDLEELFRAEEFGFTGPNVFCCRVCRKQSLEQVQAKAQRFWAKPQEQERIRIKKAELDRQYDLDRERMLEARQSRRRLSRRFPGQQILCGECGLPPAKCTCPKSQ